MPIEMANTVAEQAYSEFNRPLHQAMFSQLSHSAALRHRAFQALHEELKGTNQKEDSLRVFEREGVGYALLQDSANSLVVWKIPEEHKVAWKIPEENKPKVAVRFRTQHPIERTDFIPAYDTDYFLVRVTDPKYNYREFLARFDSALKQYSETGEIELRSSDDASALLER